MEGIKDKVVVITGASSGEKLRVTIISPGFVNMNFAEGVTNPEVKAQLEDARDKFALPPEAIARAIVFAIEQPPDAGLIRGASRTGTGLTVMHFQKEERAWHFTASA
jgi:NADP-dependent 3-hydroxy acid dehydrogenase YdfG